MTWYLIIVFHGQSSFTFCQTKSYLPSSKIKDSKRNYKQINNRCCKIFVLLLFFLALILANTVLNTYPNSLWPGIYRIVYCVSPHFPPWGLCYKTPRQSSLAILPAEKLTAVFVVSIIIIKLLNYYCSLV